MVDDIIESMAELLDANTMGELTEKHKPLHIFGEMEKSPFLRAVKSKAAKLGVPFITSSHPPYIDYQFSPVVYDHEHRDFLPCLSAVSDIDNAQHKGMSCVAEAVYMLLMAQGLVHGNTITIVGRGHSVKGLAEKLIAEDATVTVAHSKTECLLTATQGRDVVIYATPTLDKVIAYDTGELVIDLGRCVEHPNWFSCDYTNGIGKLTVSVLLNRYARR